MGHPTCIIEGLACWLTLCILEKIICNSTNSVQISFIETLKLIVFSWTIWWCYWQNVLMINEKNNFLTVSWLSGLLSAEIFISTGEWGVQMPPLTSENSYFLRSGPQGATLVMNTITTTKIPRWCNQCNQFSMCGAQVMWDKSIIGDINFRILRNTTPSLHRNKSRVEPKRGNITGMRIVKTLNSFKYFACGRSLPCLILIVCFVANSWKGYMSNVLGESMKYDPIQPVFSWYVVNIVEMHSKLMMCGNCMYTFHV